MPDEKKLTRNQPERVSVREKQDETVKIDEREKRLKETSKEKSKVSEQTDAKTPAVSRVLTKIPAAVFRSELLEDIEDVLAEGLEGYYASLTKLERKQFKQQGEKTARSIELLMSKARVKLVEIISLIRSWLALIPGMNRFFVEKESKIKADKIVLLKQGPP